MKKVEIPNNSMKLAQHLLGTCLGLEEAMEILNLIDEDFNLEEVDEQIMCCDGCGWWFEAGLVINEDGYNFCPDCYDENIESDE